jgi:hypothetical protein
MKLIEDLIKDLGLKSEDLKATEPKVEIKKLEEGDKSGKG